MRAQLTISTYLFVKLPSRKHECPDILMYVYRECRHRNYCHRTVYHCVTVMIKYYPDTTNARYAFFYSLKPDFISPTYKDTLMHFGWWSWQYPLSRKHYNDVIMSAMPSQITSLTIVFSTGYLDANQRKHQSSASLAFVRGIHRWPVNSPDKGSVTRFFIW